MTSKNGKSKQPSTPDLSNGAEFVKDARRRIGKAKGYHVSREAFARMLTPTFTSSMIEKVESGKSGLSTRLAAAITMLLLDSPKEKADE